MFDTDNRIFRLNA